MEILYTLVGGLLVLAGFLFGGAVASTKNKKEQ